MPSAVSLAIGVAAGALALEAAGAAPVVLAGSALLLVMWALRQRGGAAADRHGPRGGGIGWAALALGLIAIGLRAGSAGTAHAGPAVLPTGDGPWSATVVSVGSPKAGTRPSVLQLDGSGIVVAATLPWYPEVVPGDRIRTSGAIEPPPATDYATYLARVGAAGTLRAGALSLLPPDPGPARWLEGLRRGAASDIDRAVPEPEAGLADGILIGLRDRVDRDLAAAFTTAGASHVVAISGWNIAIVATTLGALAGGLGRRRRSVLTGLAIAAYVLFVGPSPSVMRAGAMAGLALLARELGRPSRAAAAMGWAVVGLLLVDPAWIDDAGFRLSVLATAGLMAWGTPLAARLAGPSPGRLRAWLAESMGVSLAAQAATLPVILLEFGRLSLVAPLVNLGVVPLVAPAMAAGAIALVAGGLASFGLPGAIATIGGLPAWVLLGAIVTMVRTGASVPLASVTLDPPWDGVAAVVSALAILLVARHRSRAGSLAAGLARLLAAALGRHARTSGPAPVPSAHRRGSRTRPARGPRIAAAALAAATICLALAISHRPDGATRVTMLDVGQGDAILVESSRGGRMLVDGGPDPGRLMIALDEHLPAWDHRIDILVLTHPHEDHVGGLAELLSRYRVGRIYEPGMIGPGPGYAAWAAILGHGGRPHGMLSTGDRLSLDDIRFRVLWPDPGRVPEHPADGGTAINNVSIVLLGEVGGQRFLLAGDIEEEVDPELLTRGLPHVDLLKVAHHGSKTSSTQAFLDAVHPRVAVVSVGLGNPYGHPAPATIDRLRTVAQQTYRTDRDGTVEVRLDGASLHVQTSGPRPVTAAPPGVAIAASLASRPTSGLRAGAQAAANGPSFGLAFACAIPTTGIGAVAARAVPLPTVGEAPTLPVEVGQSWSPSPAMVTADQRIATAAGWHLARLEAAGLGNGQALLYHRGDDGPLADGGGIVASLPRSPGVARAPFARGRGSGRLDRGASGAAGRRDRPADRGGGRAPP